MVVLCMRTVNVMSLSLTLTLLVKFARYFCLSFLMELAALLRREQDRLGYTRLA